MYRAIKHTRRFNLDRDNDLDAYDAILNNPLCKIIQERQIKRTVMEFGEEGQMTGKEEFQILVVTWEEKEPV